MTAPRHLGRYELLEQLGEGGMGAVWLARLSGAAGFEKLCIVKTVLPSIAKDADFVSRFLHEGRVLTQLSHGNIAQVLDMNEAEGQLFLALEYVAGVDLSRLHEQVRAANEYMPLPLVVALITQAAEGLGAAHRKHALDGTPLNIVHRDVSPHNIMVSYEGEVKVIDFGIAKSEARSRHTAQASVMGKLGYMAPEQARGEPVDHRADQFALSIVAWELLSNQQFVRRGTLTEMVVAMANPVVRNLAPLRPDVPESLEAVVLKALSPSPSNRYASTDEFAQVLMGELLKLGPPPTKPQLGEYVRARCSSDFAVTRQLLTRVSTQRSPPPQEERTRPEFDNTVLRPAASPNALTVTQAHPGQQTATLGPPVPTEQGRAAVAAPPVPTSPALPGVAAPLTPAPEPGEPGATSPARPAALFAAANPTTPAEPGETSPARPAAIFAATSGQPEAQPSPSRGARGDGGGGARVDVPSVASRADAPLTTGELALARPRRSPVLLIGGVLVLVALIGGGLAIMRPSEQPVVAAVADAGSVVKQPEVVVQNPVVDAAVLEEAVATIDAGTVMPPGLEEAIEPPVDQPAYKPPLQLAGRLAAGTWIVANREPTVLTGCRMTIPGQRVANIGTIPKGSVQVPGKRFKSDAAAPALTGMVRIDCSEGYGVIAVPR